MAYILDQNPEEEEQSLGTSQGVVGASTATPSSNPQSQQLTSSNGPIQGTGGQVSQASGSPASGGGTFTDLSKYLDANRPQARRLTENVANTVVEKGQDAKETIKSSQDLFNQDVKSGSVQQNKSLVDQAVADPTSVANNQDLKQQFFQQRDAQYKAPNSFEESQYYQPTSQKVQQAEQSRDNLQTESGRMDLLDSMYQTGGRSSRGKGLLDNLLIQSSDSSKPVLNQVQNNFAGLGDRFNNLKTDASNLAKQAKQQTEQARTYANEQLGNARTGFESGIDNRVNTLKTEAQANRDLVNSFLENISGDNMRDENYIQQNQQALDLLGIEGYEDLKRPLIYKDFTERLQDKGRYVSDSDALDFRTFLEGPAIDTAITRESVANADDYARLAALNELQGIESGYLGQFDENLAGTASNNLDKLRMEELEQRLRDVWLSMSTPGSSGGMAGDALGSFGTGGL